LIYSRCKHSIIPGELISIKVVIGGIPLGCEKTESRLGERVNTDPLTFKVGGEQALIACILLQQGGRTFLI